MIAFSLPPLLLASASPRFSAVWSLSPLEFLAIEFASSVNSRSDFNLFRHLF